jgi:hypothetical protein
LILDVEPQPRVIFQRYFIVSLLSAALHVFPGDRNESTDRPPQ